MGPKSLHRQQTPRCCWPEDHTLSDKVRGLVLKLELHNFYFDCACIWRDLGVSDYQGATIHHDFPLLSESSSSFFPRLAEPAASIPDPSMAYCPQAHVLSISTLQSRNQPSELLAMPEHPHALALPGLCTCCSPCMEPQCPSLSVW